ncbi:MAG: hypothetical protein P8166_11135 [Candidatus Thiodiazotropha sp.]
MGVGSNLLPGTYTTAQLLRLYGITDPKLPVLQYYQGVRDDDFAERAYVFGSGSYKVNDDAIFTVNSNGSRSISNICVEPIDDNFDYESSSLLATITNALTKDEIDPSGIGRKVPIEFTGSVTNRQSFTDADWQTLENLNDDALNAELLNKADIALSVPYFSAQFALLLGRLAFNDIITYEDGDGRYVVFDGKDINNNGTIDPNLLLNKTEWIPYNGTAVIGGGGDDTIYGTDYSDYLDGGEGDDTTWRAMVTLSSIPRF